MPNAMFAATPPRRTSSRSTRNDSETWCNASGISWSVNRPGKVIRWSVAIEPVTAIRKAELLDGLVDVAWVFQAGQRYLHVRVPLRVPPIYGEVGSMLPQVSR